MTTAYADWTYYEATYLGNKIAELDFPRLALRASAQIDALTFNRAATDTDNTDALSMACCAVAEEIQLIENEGDSDGVQSETIGQNSVTYNADASKQKTKQTRYADVASTYLASTGLMFQGFAVDEYAD